MPRATGRRPSQPGAPDSALEYRFSSCVSSLPGVGGFLLPTGRQPPGNERERVRILHLYGAIRHEFVGFAVGIGGRFTKQSGLYHFPPVERQPPDAFTIDGGPALDFLNI